jgi:hypothetical protein
MPQDITRIADVVAVQLDRLDRRLSAGAVTILVFGDRCKSAHLDISKRPTASPHGYAKRYTTHSIDESDWVVRQPVAAPGHVQIGTR